MKIRSKSTCSIITYLLNIHDRLVGRSASIPRPEDPEEPFGILVSSDEDVDVDFYLDDELVLGSDDELSDEVIDCEMDAECDFVGDIHFGAIAEITDI